MINHDNLIEYADPILYDLENQGFEPTGPFYLSLAQEVGGSVLELGCGTGRYTIPLAQAGIDITGLDVVPGMLTQAGAKANDLPITWVEADSRDFHLGRQFDLIIATGAMFHHLLTRVDMEATLSCIHHHLTADGTFATDLLFPHRHLQRNIEEEEDWFTITNGQGQEIRVSGIQTYDAFNQIRTETAYRRWTDETGQAVERDCALVFAMYLPPRGGTSL